MTTHRPTSRRNTTSFRALLPRDGRRICFKSSSQFTFALPWKAVFPRTKILSHQFGLWRECILLGTVAHCFYKHLAVVNVHGQTNLESQGRRCPVTLVKVLIFSQMNS